MEEPQEPTLRERFTSLLDELPIEDFNEPPTDKLAGVEAEINATFDRLRGYLEAVDRFRIVRGYHRALVHEQTESRKRAGGDGGWWTEELKRFDDSGRYMSALNEVREVQTEEVGADLEKVKRLLALHGPGIGVW